MNFTILTYDTIDSTNTEALKQARLGADEGLCIVARSQTAGRGRYGRTWVSEKDAGLYFSVILRPKIEMTFLPLITLMTGVAVHDSLLELGIEPDIKWVNDVLVNEKKIAGILAETTETPRGLAVVVGIGINLRSSNFPTEIAADATSVEESVSQTVSSNGMARILTSHLDRFYKIFTGPGGPPVIIEEWRQRSSYFQGKRVRVSVENVAITGVTDGLEANGALRLLRADGSIVIIQAGDVERVRPEL